MDDTDRPMAKRVSQTCVTCRARKVRCDGRRNICSNCERLGFSCSFDDGPGSGSDAAMASSEGGAAAGAAPDQTMPAIPRRRARQACQNCHSRKARCSGGMPQCDRCRSLGIECVYRPGKRSRMSPVSGSVGSGAGAGAVADSGRDDLQFGQSRRSESSDRVDETGAGGGAPGPRGTVGSSLDTFDRPIRPCPDDVLAAIAMRAFDQFFRHIYHIPTFAFLHRTSLMQRYRAGLVDRPLLLALVGITALMTDLGPGTKDLGNRCIAEAESLVLSRLEKPTTLGLQTLVFIIHHRIHAGRFSSAFMLHGVASRFAAALQLNHENARLCFLARESRRRLMWAIYIIDTSMANGSTDLSLWAYRPDMVDIQLPCNERNFEFDIAEKAETLHPPIGDGSAGGGGSAGSMLSPPPVPDDMGFLALHVRIRALRGRILQYTKHITTHIATTDIATVPAHCAELAAELDTFQARLPSSFRWSEANVRLRTYSPRLCVFLMTHVWWEQCHCELYRIALAGLQEAIPAPYVNHLDASFVQFCRSQVYSHAKSMAEMFQLLLTLENGVPVTDLDLPICLYQCARLLYYIGRSPHQPSPGDGGPPPHETYADLARICLRVLEQAITTPAALRIRANLEKLLVHGISTDTTPSGHSSPEIADMEMDDIAELLPGMATNTGSTARPAMTPQRAPGMNGVTPGGNGGPGLNGGNGSGGGGAAGQGAAGTPGMNGGGTGMNGGTSAPAALPITLGANVPPLMSPGEMLDVFGNGFGGTPHPGSTGDGPSGLNSVPGALDAFDLDIDVFGANNTDLTSWFSGDWPAEFTT